MVFNDDSMGDRKPLTGPFSDPLCREEWQEDFLQVLFLDSRARILDTEKNMLVVMPCFNDNLPVFSLGPNFGDCIGSIH